jgi:hypothetical protein
MNASVKVPKGISGRPIVHDVDAISIETMKNEVALLALGDFEPLKIVVNVEKYKKEIAEFDNDWVDYLPRVDRPNNRQGLSFTSMPGDNHNDVPSLAEICYKHNRRVSELEICEPTILYEKVKSLHKLFNLFPTLGRTFVVKSNAGGYFVPHRDHPSLNRESFRLIVFPVGVGPYEYDWLMDDKKMFIEPGRVYYVNTRKMHRTISWIDNSQHIILNVPMTSENVATVIANYQHKH